MNASDSGLFHEVFEVFTEWCTKSHLDVELEEPRRDEADYLRPPLTDYDIRQLKSAMSSLRFATLPWGLDLHVPYPLVNHPYAVWPYQGILVNAGEGATVHAELFNAVVLLGECRISIAAALDLTTGNAVRAVRKDAWQLRDLSYLDPEYAGKRALSAGPDFGPANSPAALAAVTCGPTTLRSWHTIFSNSLANALLGRGYRALAREWMHFVPTANATWEWLTDYVSLDLVGDDDGDW